MLPDDGECDRTENELSGPYPRLLDGCHLGEAAPSSHRQDLAQILSVPVHLHDLPVPALCGHSACSLHGWVQARDLMDLLSVSECRKAEGGEQKGTGLNLQPQITNI